MRDDDDQDGRGREAKSSGSGGGGGGEMVEQLIGSVHRLSVASLASMATADRKDEANDPVQLERWQRLMSSVTANWIGGAMSNYAADSGAILAEIFRREFGPGSPLLDVIDKFEERRDSWIKECPSLVVTITGGHKSLERIWEQITFDVWIEGRKAGEVGAKIPLDPPLNNLRVAVRVWKGITNSTEKKLVGSASIPLEQVQTPARIHLEEVCSQKYSSSWIEVRVEIARSHLHRGPCAILNEILTGCLADAFHNGGVSNGLVDSEPDSTCEYSVVVQRSIGMDGARCSVMNGDGTLDFDERDEVEFPLRNILTDELVLKAEFEEDLTGGKRRSTLWPNEKEDKKKKRRSQLINDTLAAAVADVHDSSSGSAAADTDNREHTVLVADVPWSGFMTVLQRKDVRWKISVRGRFANRADKSEPKLDAAFHYYRLYDTVLNHLAKSRGDLLLWDGSLSAVTAASTLDTVASPFLQDSASSTERDLAIVALHERHRFNNEVVFGALCRLIKNGFDVMETEHYGIRSYAGWCLTAFLGLSGPEKEELLRDRYPKRRQMAYVIHNMDLLYQKKSGDDLEGALRSKLRYFFETARDIVAVADYLEVDFTIGLKMLDKTLGEGSRWALAVKSAVATEFLAAAERFIGNCKMRLDKKHSDEDRKTVECFYRTYVFFRKLGVPNLSPLELASVFEPFLFTWVDLVKIKASEQVSISMGLTRKTHKKLLTRRPSTMSWRSTSTSDWTETAGYINGIFDTCNITWGELEWPDPVRNVEFGRRLFLGMHEVFIEYVAEFYRVVMLDDEFDRTELVLILSNVLRSMKYLKDSKDALSSVMGRIADAEFSAGGKRTTRSVDKLKEEVAAFTETFENAVGEADDRAEDIVLNFCECQKNDIRARMRKPPGDDDDDVESVLDFLDSLLRFVNVSLRHEQDAAKYIELLNREIFKSLDELLKEEYEIATAAYSRSKDPSAFEPLLAVLADSLEFRRTISAGAADPRLSVIQRELFPRSLTTSDLIARLIRGNLNNRADDDRQTFGQVAFRAYLLEDRVVVQLLRVSDLKPRSDKEDTCNFSVTLTVLPLCQEPYLDRQRTLNYEKKREVDFEGNSGAVDRAEFVFDLPTANRKFHPGDAFLQVDLFHQLPYRKQKVFGGSATVCLGDLHVAMDDGGESARYIEPIRMAFTKPRFDAKSPVYKELKARKDALARIFIERYDKIHLEKPIFESNEWARFDDEVAAAQLIYEHAQELRGKEGDYFAHHYTAPAATIEARVAFNKTRQIVLVRLERLLDVRPRLGSAEGEAVNASVGVRIIPTKALEQRTKIYQDTKEMRFKRKSCAKTVPKKKKPSTWDYLTPEKCKTKHTTQDSDDSEMEFRLHKVNFNERHTFVELSIYDHERSIWRSKSERIFLGHVLIPLQGSLTVFYNGKTFILGAVPLT